MQPNTNRIFTKNASVRFSLKAEIRLSTVHFVPETDVNIIREGKSLSVILALRF